MTLFFSFFPPEDNQGTVTRSKRFALALLIGLATGNVRQHTASNEPGKLKKTLCNRKLQTNYTLNGINIDTNLVTLFFKSL